MGPIVFVRYHAGSVTESAQPLANFGDQMQLMTAEFTDLTPDRVRIELLWAAQELSDREVKVFVHIIDGEGHIVAQSDALLSGGYFPIDWWRPGLFVREEHDLELSTPFDSTNYDILVGVYNPATEERLPILDAAGHPVGDAWLLPTAESR